MKFFYSVVNAKNKIQKGVIDAANLKEATQSLVEQGWFIKKIAPRGKVKSGFINFSIGGVPLLDQVLFVKHLATMLKSGITLNEALLVIAEQTSSPRFKKIIRSILERVQTGQNLSNALARYPKVFNPFFINIIRVGEESGTLEANLNYLASELEDRLDLRRKIKAASFYPAIVLAATFGLGLVLAYFVLPKITDLFSTLQFELPLSTRILLASADILENYGTLLLVGLIAAVIVLRLIVALQPVKPWWHAFLLKLPLLGQMLIDYNLTIIARTMAILLKSGLTIDQAMRVTMEISQNFVYRRHLETSLKKIEQGKRFADALAEIKQSGRKPLFPILVIRMIGVGERSGRLDESLSYIADYFEKEIDNTTKNLTTVLEPLLLIFVGLIVGFVAVSVISPIYQVTGQFRR